MAAMSHLHSTAIFGNVSLQPFWKSVTMADTGTISNASISENVHNILVYICTNFGAFIKN